MPDGWSTIQRLPIGPNLYFLLALILPLIGQRNIRLLLASSALVMMYLFLGLWFALGAFSACVAAWLLTEQLARIAQHSGQTRVCLTVGWITIHAAYWPLCFAKLPAIPDMWPGDLTLFCGGAFFVIRAIHVLTDRVTGHLPRSTFLNYLTYMTYAPTFRLGPFDRYDHFQAEVDTCLTRIRWRTACRSIIRMTGGIAKMLCMPLLIDAYFFSPRFAGGGPVTQPFLPEFFENAASQPTSILWIATWLFFLRIYLFFSGYSDVAIACSTALGIRVDENFRWPLLSPRLSIYWRRWHISLGNWLRDYIYIPLGGNRRHATPNLTAVFVYSGIWHLPFPFFGGLWFGLAQAIAVRIDHWVDTIRGPDAPPPRTRRRWQTTRKIGGSILGFVITYTIMSLTVLLLFDRAPQRYLCPGFHVIALLFKPLVGESLPLP